MDSNAIDLATFTELQETAGAEFVNELVDTYFEEAPGMLAELRNAHAQRAADRFRRAAHSLKSNSNTFGALTLGKLARELELGGLRDDVALIDALEVEYARVVAALKELRHG
jgi:histidine phosphotransfer protein HptB